MWFMTHVYYMKPAKGKHLTFPCNMSDSLWVNISAIHILAYLYMLHLHNEFIPSISKYPSFNKH